MQGNVYMNPNELKEMLKAGFSRFLNEGFSHWTESDVTKAINPREVQNKLSDPHIQQILRELEAEGVIKMKHEGAYLVVL